MDPHPVVRLTGLRGPVLPFEPSNNLVLEVDGRSVNPLGGAVLLDNPLGCDTVASWLSKQVYAPHFIKLSV